LYELCWAVGLGTTTAETALAALSAAKSPDLASTCADVLWMVGLELDSAPSAAEARPRIVAFIKEMLAC
jgi:hypothetical protein